MTPIRLDTWVEGWQHLENTWVTCLGEDFANLLLDIKIWAQMPDKRVVVEWAIEALLRLNAERSGSDLVLLIDGSWAAEDLMPLFRRGIAVALESPLGSAAGRWMLEEARVLLPGTTLPGPYPELARGRSRG